MVCESCSNGIVKMTRMGGHAGRAATLATVYPSLKALCSCESTVPRQQRLCRRRLHRRRDPGVGGLQGRHSGRTRTRRAVACAGQMGAGGCRTGRAMVSTSSSKLVFALRVIHGFMAWRGGWSPKSLNVSESGARRRSFAVLEIVPIVIAAV